jgi:hypothetical protein
MKCEAISRSGRRCNAQALRGKTRCLMHSGLARELGSLGGRSARDERRRQRAQMLEQLPPPRTGEDAIRMIGQCVIELRAGTLMPKVAGSIFYGLGILIRSLEVSEVEPRLRKLEQEAERRKEHANGKFHAAHREVGRA